MFKKLFFVLLTLALLLALVPAVPAHAKDDDCLDNCWVNIQDISGSYITVTKAITHGDANEGSSWVEVHFVKNGVTQRTKARALSFQRWYVDSRGFSWTNNVPVFPTPRGRGHIDPSYAGWLEYEEPNLTFEINKGGFVNTWYSEIGHLAVFETDYKPTFADREVQRIYKYARGEDLTFSFWYAEPATRLLWDSFTTLVITDPDKDSLAGLLKLPENSFLYWKLYVGLESARVDDVELAFTGAPVLCERIPNHGDSRRIGVYTYEDGHRVKYIEIFNIEGTLFVDGIKPNKNYPYVGILTVPTDTSHRPPNVSDIRWFCP